MTPAYTRKIRQFLETAGALMITVSHLQGNCGTIESLVDTIYGNKSRSIQLPVGGGECYMPLKIYTRVKTWVMIAYMRNNATLPKEKKRKRKTR